MSVPSAALIAAFADNDLYERIVALAATVGVTPDQVAQARWQMVIAAANDSGTDTIASVYDYAMETRAQAVAALPPAPGINPGAVTDTHILYALGKVFPPQP